MDNRRSFLKKSALAALALSAPMAPGCASQEPIRASVPMKSRRVKRALVTWYSQTGNTQRYGQLPAATMRQAGVQVDAGDMREVDKDRMADYDLIVVGSPVFYLDAPAFVQDWVHSLPDLEGMPVAVYVSFGGPEGNQHNAACSVLECLAERRGAPVALESFMNLGTYPLSWAGERIKQTPWRHRELPNQQTYARVRQYAGHILGQVARGQTAEFARESTWQELVIAFDPIFWIKGFVEEHYLLADACIGCGACEAKCPVGAINLANHAVNRSACVMCFGCLNNCPAGAVYMEYEGARLIGYPEFLKIKNIKTLEPKELRALENSDPKS